MMAREDTVDITFLTTRLRLFTTFFNKMYLFRKILYKCKTTTIQTIVPLDYFIESGQSYIGIHLHRRQTYENCFARAFGGAGGTCECRGGDAPHTPPLLVTSRAIPPFFVFFKNSFLANERENIFGGLTVKVITRFLFMVSCTSSIYFMWFLVI